MATFLKKKSLQTQFAVYLRLLLYVILVAVLLHVFWQYIYRQVGGDNRIVNDIAHRMGLDEELSFPTWLNSALAMIVGLLAWLVAKVQKEFSKKATWYLIAGIGIFISIDEVVALHELLLQALHILAKFGEGQGLLANAWILTVPFLVIMVAMLMRVIYKNLPRDTFTRFAVAISVYLLGAFVVEFVSIPLDKSSVLYNFVAVVLEEGLELIGVWLAIRAVMLHIVQHEGLLRKRLADIFND